MAEPTFPPQPDYFVPDECSVAHALARTTHLAIVAHQDDLEINCFHGIAACYRQPHTWFTGIVLSDGAGSPRSGHYADVSDSEMVRIRQQEQRSAARLGGYSIAIQYGASSTQLQSGPNPELVTHLKQYLLAAKPRVVYVHNLADRHDTRVHVALHALEALRRLPAQQQPQQVYGVEGWGSLDWLPRQYRFGLDVGKHRNLATELVRVFESQLTGGKSYDIASEGRHVANATFDQSHAVNAYQYQSLAMDLMPLLADPAMTPRDYLAQILDKFRTDTLNLLTARERQEK
ncbi:MAG: hypothetical protein Hals2KO_15150 [Halioglobus sp.]